MNFAGLPLGIRQKVVRCLEMFNKGFPILIRGETGVGKSFLAREFHRASRWKDGEFVRVDLASLENDLFESQLFGYDRGTFTGGLIEGKVGLLDLAQGGTVFFDEIGNLNLRYQKKLLIFLDDRRYRRVGGKNYIHLNAGIIFATNVDIRGALTEGKLREDLYHRIKTCEIELPPLRARLFVLEEIIELLIKIKNLKPLKFTPEAIEKMKEYSWPGNLRELLNFLVELGSLGKRTIEVSDLPEHVKNNNKADSNGRIRPELIINELSKTGGNVKETATRLGVSRQYLYKLFRTYRINPADYRR